MRPEIDLIFRTPEGMRALPESTVSALAACVAAVGLSLAEGVTYPLHPVTTGFAHVMAWPGRVACAEVRRDLLTEAFVPFRQVQIDSRRVKRIAEAFAAWMGTAWS